VAFNAVVGVVTNVGVIVPTPKVVPIQLETLVQVMAVPFKVGLNNP
jgi:hypothetical protein